MNYVEEMPLVRARTCAHEPDAGKRIPEVIEDDTEFSSNELGLDAGGLRQKLC